MLRMVNKVIQNSLLSIKISSKVISILVFGFLSISTTSHAAVDIAIQDRHKMNDEKYSNLILRKAGERGLSKNDWLVSRHTFSFADYYDPKHSGFRDLLVINEDKIQGGKGFGSHPHKNMEIISYVMSGALKHKDSMGNETIIRPNEVQRMSAGSGVIHSEFNHVKDNETHFYQIWITPRTKGVSPSYAQKSFEKEFKENKLVLVASNTGREGSITIDQDVNIYISRLGKEKFLEFKPSSNRHIWIQMIKGKMTVNGQEILEGDGLFGAAKPLHFKTLENSEFIVFDLK